MHGSSRPTAVRFLVRIKATQSFESSGKGGLGRGNVCPTAPPARVLADTNDCDVCCCCIFEAALVPPAGVGESVVAPAPPAGASVAPVAVARSGVVARDLDSVAKEAPTPNPNPVGVALPGVRAPKRDGVNAGVTTPPATAPTSFPLTLAAVADAEEGHGN